MKNTTNYYFLNQPITATDISEIYTSTFQNSSLNNWAQD